MTVTIPADPAIPDRPDPQRLAVPGLAEWLHEDPAAAEEHEEAMRADSYQHEMQRRREAAERVLADASARLALIDKHNLDGRRTLGFWLGSAIVVALVVLDAIPLNWAAQAFDLNNADSWLVTLILLVASVGAMAGLEATRQDARRYAALVALTLTAYAGLVALAYFFPGHGGRRRLRRRPPAGRRAQRDLRGPGLPRVGRHGADAVAAAVPGPGRRAPGAPHQPGERSGLAPGRGEAGAPPWCAAPAAGPAAPVRSGADRADPP